MRTILFCALALSSVWGCGYRSREQSLTAADLQVPARTRITNYMSAPLRQFQPSEQAPGAISRSVLLDEARIARVAADEICFDVVVRTDTTLDTALSEMRVLIDGKPGRVGAEEVTVRDYAFSGERDVLVADHVSNDSLASLRLTAPVEKVLRVIERRGQICRSTNRGSKRGELALEVIIVRDDNRGNWGEKFVWSIE